MQVRRCLCSHRNVDDNGKDMGKTLLSVGNFDLYLLYLFPLRCIRFCIVFTIFLVSHMLLAMCVLFFWSSGGIRPLLLSTSTSFGELRSAGWFQRRRFGVVFSVLTIAGYWNPTGACSGGMPVAARQKIVEWPALRPPLTIASYRRTVASC